MKEKVRKRLDHIRRCRDGDMRKGYKKDYHLYPQDRIDSMKRKKKHED